MRRAIRLAAMLMSVLLCAVFLPVTAYAEGSIAPDRALSLTLTQEAYDGVPVAMTHHLILVSTMDSNGELTPTELFAAYTDALDIRGRNDAAWAQLAPELAAEVRTNPAIPQITGQTNDLGELTFTSADHGLVPGLYLVLTDKTLLSPYVFSALPFVVTLPGRDSAQNAWVYDVQANVKIERSPELADLSVVKYWDDGGNVTARPTSVQIQLERDGEAYGEPIELPSGGRWDYTWSALDMTHEWSVSELPVAGYRVKSIELEGTTWTITNETEPTNPPTPPDELKTTGGNITPLAGLFSLGLLFIVVGFALRRRAAREN